jgi:hypothetical protein
MASSSSVVPNRNWFSRPVSALSHEDVRTGLEHAAGRYSAAEPGSAEEDMCLQITSALNSLNSGNPSLACGTLYECLGTASREGWSNDFELFDSYIGALETPG